MECCFCHGIREFKHDCQRDGARPGSTRILLPSVFGCHGSQLLYRPKTEDEKHARSNVCVCVCVHACLLFVYESHFLNGSWNILHTWGLCALAGKSNITDREDNCFLLSCAKNEREHVKQLLLQWVNKLDINFGSKCVKVSTAKLCLAVLMICTKIILYNSFYVVGLNHDSGITISQLSPGSSCIPHERPHGKTDRSSQQPPSPLKKEEQANASSPLGGTRLWLVQ